MKIVEKLREIGWIDQMKDLMKKQNITPAVMEASLEIIFHYDPDVEDAWAEDIYQMAIKFLWDEIQKESALDQVDPEALFKRATGKPVFKEIEITDPEVLEKFTDALNAILKGVEE